MVRLLKQRTDSQAEVVIENDFPGGRMVGGKYRMAAHEVTIYKDPIARQCLRLFGSLDRLEEYAVVVCAHELGHAEDRELASLSLRLDEAPTRREQAQIALRIEVNAWRYAEAALPDFDPVFMQTIIDESLAAYREELRDDIA